MEKLRIKYLPLDNYFLVLQKILISQIFEKLLLVSFYLLCFIICDSY